MVSKELIDAMGVAGQVMQDMLRSAKRPLPSDQNSQPHAHLSERVEVSSTG